MTKIVVIPDIQARAGVDTSHLNACGNLIKKELPDIIVELGDLFDFPIFSNYATALEKEGGRVRLDLEAGNDALEIINNAIEEAMEENPKWKPELYFLKGNHEHRFDRWLEANPEFSDFFDEDDLFPCLTNWEVIPFLTAIEIEGIWFSHYFPNQFTGKPIGGTVQNMINKLGFSFIQGHKQTEEFYRKHLNNGKVHTGLISGSFYTHEERYKGKQGNHHFRGMAVLRDVKGGDYKYQPLTIDELKNAYGVD